MIPSKCHPDQQNWAKGQCYYCYYSLREVKETRRVERRRHRLRSRYGISVEEYDALLAKQSGVCAICLRPCRTGRSLAVDHDHRTNVVRGLLCVVHNQMLGAADDDVDLLRRAIAYLLEHRAT